MLGVDMKINAVNQLKAEEVLYNEGDATGCLYMVLKGRLRLKGRGYVLNPGVGSILGIEQLDGESFKNLCYTQEGAGVYALNADTVKTLGNLLKSNKDYGGIAVFNHAGFLKEYVLQYRRLCAESEALYNELKDYYAKYLGLINSSGCKAPLIPEIPQLEQPDTFKDADDRIEAYLEYSKIPLDTMKAFYATGGMLAAETIVSLYELEEDMQEACNEACDYMVNAFMLLSGDENYSLYRNLLSLGIEMKAAGVNTADLDDMIGGCFARRDRIKAIITQTTGSMWYDNEEIIKSLYLSYKSGEDFRAEGESDNAADGETIYTLDSLNDTMKQLIEFGEYPEDKAEAFEAAVDQYMNMQDRDSTDDVARKLRSTLATHYYDLYYRVAVNYLDGKAAEPAIEMFLDFGLLSEKLLTKDQLAELAAVKRDLSSSPCAVHSMSKWLKGIYDGSWDPSRNGMGQDYLEMIREMKKNGALDAEHEKQMLKDKKKKLEHEIKEVLMAGNRVVNGQLSIFVPFIHSGMFIGKLDSAYNSGTKINDAVNRILGIDFSLFRRETLYSDVEGGIDREYLMKQVYPDFIVFPMVGQNIIMWQEICGRKRDTPARFFVPAFSYGNFDDMLVKACGRFRWDMCKTIQGPNWNNIQMHSLTSEYSDYIQFFKKNHDLSDERKEKIKLQIQRGRNNLREIFTLDYEVWIKNESTGAMKLNKVVREILATYCPFAAPIKKKVTSQPMYEEAFMRDTRERGKKARELQLRMKGMENKGIEIPDELRETLDYYTKM